MSPAFRLSGFAFVLVLSCVALSELARAEDATDPIDLFAKVYPVFSHPRCVNCHGVVKDLPNDAHSLTGVGHGGGPVDSHEDKCSDCHNEPDEVEEAWTHTAPDFMSFVGKNLAQMCALQSKEVLEFHDRPGGYREHIRVDPLIKVGFAGTAGGKIDPPQPPPMTHARWLEGMQRWLDAGHACGRWSGTVSQIEEFSSDYGYPYPAGKNGTVTVHESAKREVKITRADGNTSAEVTMGGHAVITIHYEDVGVNGPCTVTVTSTTDWVGTSPGPMPADLGIAIRENGAYELSFALPREQSRVTTSSKTENTCGALNVPAEPESTDLDWPGWRWRFECKGGGGGTDESGCARLDPTRPPDLKGQAAWTVIGNPDAKEKAWLNDSTAGTARGDNGAPLPVNTATVWDLHIVP